MCVLLSRVQLFATPWTVACQAPLFMEFSRPEYWRLLFLYSRAFSWLKDQTRISRIVGRFFTESPGKPNLIYPYSQSTAIASPQHPLIWCQCTCSPFLISSLSAMHPFSSGDCSWRMRNSSKAGQQCVQELWNLFFVTNHGQLGQVPSRCGP